MTPSTSQLLRWTFIGPLMGVLINAPILWIMASPFDRSIHSLDNTLFVCTLAYAYGVPSAFMTSVVYRWLERNNAQLGVERSWILPIAAIFSTYFLWIIVIGDLLNGKVEGNQVAPITAWLAATGVVSAAVMLRTERETAK